MKTASITGKGFSKNLEGINIRDNWKATREISKTVSTTVTGSSNYLVKLSIGVQGNGKKNGEGTETSADGQQQHMGYGKTTNCNDGRFTHYF